MLCFLFCACKSWFDLVVFVLCFCLLFVLDVCIFVLLVICIFGVGFVLVFLLLLSALLL